MNTLSSKIACMCLSLLAFTAIASTPGCLGSVDAEGEDAITDEAVTPGSGEDVGQSEDAIKGAIFRGCPAGTWWCGYGCTSTDYSCA